MLHKNVLTLVTSERAVKGDLLQQALPSQTLHPAIAVTGRPQTAPRLALVPPGGGVAQPVQSSALFDLVAAAAPRCSSFLAEAAVLVLVLALLDRFMLKGRMEMSWILSAFAISGLLLAASVATDFTSRRWLQRR